MFPIASSTSGRRPLPLADAGPFPDKPDSFENAASVLRRKWAGELLLFSCHSLFITNHVLSSMT